MMSSSWASRDRVGSFGDEPTPYITSWPNPFELSWTRVTWIMHSRKERGRYVSRHTWSFSFRVSVSVRGLTPRSKGPATAGFVRPVRGFTSIFTNQPYKASLRGPLSSNVRPRKHAMSVPQSLQRPIYLLALLPLLVPATAWLREAMWFKPPMLGLVGQLLLFNLLAAVVIYTPSVIALAKLKSRWALMFTALVLSTIAVVVARQGVIAFVAWGYSQEHAAYTSALAAAASKRGLLFVLCAATLPLLLAGIIALRHRRLQAT
jgi:hypothetical protein